MNGGAPQNQTKTSGRDLHTGVKQDRTPHLSLAGRIRTGAGQNVVWPGRALETGCLGSSWAYYSVSTLPILCLSVYTITTGQ